MRKSGINKNTVIMKKEEFRGFLQTKNAYHFDYQGWSGYMEYKLIDKRRLLGQHPWFYKVILVSKQVKFKVAEYSRKHWDYMHWVIAYNKSNGYYYITRYDRKE